MESNLVLMSEMKHVQLSGMQKRKSAKENEQNNLSGVAKTRKVTDSFYKLQRKKER